jgi:Zn-dependent peptidase ImmA (M78 family)
MSTRWETLAGDTSKFALKMSFIADTSEIPVATDVAASWGSFELWVNGMNLCAHVEEGETLEAVHWYLLPLLEWLAANWNPMLHEERLPIRNAGEDAVSSLYRTRFAGEGVSKDRAIEHDNEWYAWRQRHALHAAREGGLFPEVFLRRWEDKVEASWSNQPPPGPPPGFAFLVPHGRAILDPVDVAGALYAVIRAAVGQLQAWEPESERLTDLVAVVRDLNKPRVQRASRLDWLFDLRAGAADHTTGSWDAMKRLFQPAAAKVRRAILEPAGTGLVLQGSSHAVLLFGSVSPAIEQSDARALADLLVGLFDENGDPAELLAVVAEAESAPLEGPPWEQGYDLAECAHDALTLTGDGRIDIEAVLGRLGVQVEALSLSDHRLRGVAVAGPQHRPAVVHNDTHPRNLSREGRRFTVAHELCHLLIDRRVGRKLAIASGPWAPIEVEQRANAFAASFLMPPDRVRSIVAGLAEPVASMSSVLTVAETFETSPRATLEHLHNLGFLDDFERDVLRGTSLDDQTFDRPTVEIGG